MSIPYNMRATSLQSHGLCLRAATRMSVLALSAAARRNEPERSEYECPSWVINGNQTMPATGPIRRNKQTFLGTVGRALRYYKLNSSLFGRSGSTLISEDGLNAQR